MQELPICSQCGQDEEYLISETDEYMCICGHQFKKQSMDTDKKENQVCNHREEKTNAYQATYQHRSTSLLH